MSASNTPAKSGGLGRGRSLSRSLTSFQPRNPKSPFDFEGLNNPPAADPIARPASAASSARQRYSSTTPDVQQRTGGRSQRSASHQGGERTPPRSQHSYNDAMDQDAGFQQFGSEPCSYLLLSNGASQDEIERDAEVAAEALSSMAQWLRAVVVTSPHFTLDWESLQEALGELNTAAQELPPAEEETARLPPPAPVSSALTGQAPAPELYLLE